MEAFLPYAPIALSPLAGLGIAALSARLSGQAPPRLLSPSGLGVVALAALAAVWAAVVETGLPSGIGAALGWTLLALALTDIRAMRLPDVLTLPLILAGLGLAAVEPSLSAADHLIGAAGAGALGYALAEGYRAWRGRDGLGLGDVKLLAGAGAWLGWAALPGMVFIAAAAAAATLALTGRRDRALPFGPFIAAAFWLVWLYGPPF